MTNMEISKNEIENFIFRIFNEIFHVKNKILARILAVLLFVTLFPIIFTVATYQWIKIKIKRLFGKY